MAELKPADFEKMFGGPLCAKTFEEISLYDFHYKSVDADTSSYLIGLLNQRCERRDFSIAGEKTDRWQRGWAENLEEFRRTKDIAALEPKYLRPSRYLRLHGRFIEPTDPMFERNWYRIFRGWFARRYLALYDSIYEFGCGSGHNVAFLTEEFPGKLVMGLDWAEASVEIVQELRRMGRKTGGYRFDFFNPRRDGWKFQPNTAVLTVGALEQTGTRWRPFMEFLQAAQPAACFHIEPMLQCYDPSDPVDATAIRIHGIRGFWSGFEGGTVHRTGFGSLLLEGYSQAFWKPFKPEDTLLLSDPLEDAA